MQQAIAVLMAVGVTTIVGRAQQTEPSGIAASLDFTQRLEYNNNTGLQDEGESDFFGRTLIRFRLDSIKSIDRLSLSLNTDIEQGARDARSNFDFANPSLGLSYQRNSSNARIGTTLQYSERDVNGDGFDEDFDRDGNVITQDRGTQESLRFGVDGVVGVNAPISAEYDLSYGEINYSGTTDPDLTDSSTLILDGTLNFRLSPRVTSQLIARYSDFDAQGNGVDRETTGIGIGAEFVVNPVLSINATLRYDRIERSGDEVRTDDGLSINAGLTRAFKTGTLGLSLASDVSTNDGGSRTSLRLNRTVDLPRAQSLSYSLGATRSDGTGVNTLYGLNYTYTLPAGRITASLSQTVVTDSNNQEEINTRLRAGYQQDINSLSSLGVRVSFFGRNELGPSANDGQRLDLNLSYRYALTRDWGLVSGYRYILSEEDDRDNRESNTVFIGLQRSFDWQP